VRIHSRAIQERIFRLMGYDGEQIEALFGTILEALEYGAPPHGGIATGLDRLIAILASADSIRDAIAFPKNQTAADLMMDAPSPVGEAQLAELHVRLALPPAAPAAPAAPAPDGAPPPGQPASGPPSRATPPG
jgi:aspartyl-tRNA synthetase